MSVKLKEAREAAGYSIEDVASILNVRGRYLVALEDGDMQAIPGKVYAEGYLRLYSKFLGVTVISAKEIPLPEEPIRIQLRQGFKKYLFIGCAIMLIITMLSYSWIAQESSSTGILSIIDNTGFSHGE